MFVFLTTIACGTVMLPIDSLIHWGDVGYTANVVNQYLVWETVEVDASLINVDPTLAAQTPDAVSPMLETPRAMIEFMATVAGVTPFPQGTPISEETPAACREDPPGPSCPPPPPATPTPVITVTTVISNSDCASVSVIMENTANLEGEFCQENLDPLYSGQPLPLFCQVYAYIPNARGTPEPYLEYIVPSYDLLEAIENAGIADIPFDVPEPRPTCALPCPPDCQCLSGLRSVARDGYESDDDQDEALTLHPDTWDEVSEYIREYREDEKRTFHKPGDQDCLEIDRDEWMGYDHFHIELIQDPYVTPSDVSSQARIVLPATYSAGCSGFGSCDMHGGTGDTTPPSEDPWFCVRPAPSKCADFDDGSYIVTIQGHLPMPPPPPPPPPTP